MTKLRVAGRIVVAGCVWFGITGPAAAQCNCIYAAPCTITTNLADLVGPSEHTFCTVRSSAGYVSVVYMLTTPNGRQYRIENPLTMFDTWFINGSPGVRLPTADPAHPCYRSPRLQICLRP